MKSNSTSHTHTLAHALYFLFCLLLRELLTWRGGTNLMCFFIAEKDIVAVLRCRYFTD